MTTVPFVQKGMPWGPPDYDDDTIYAIRALAAGHANGPQQTRAWNYIMHVAGVDDLEFRPDEMGGRRASDFAGGKRFVGKMLMKLLSPFLTPHARDEEEDPVPTRRAGSRSRTKQPATKQRRR